MPTKIRKKMTKFGRDFFAAGDSGDIGQAYPRIGNATARVEGVFSLRSETVTPVHTSFIPEQSEAAREAVNVRLAADWADLSAAEEAAHRHLADLLAECIGVVVGAAEPALA